MVRLGSDTLAPMERSSWNTDEADSEGRLTANAASSRAQGTGQQPSGARSPGWWLPGLVICVVLVASGLVLLKGLQPVFYLSQSFKTPQRGAGLRHTKSQQGTGQGDMPMDTRNLHDTGLSGPKYSTAVGNQQEQWLGKSLFQPLRAPSSAPVSSPASRFTQNLDPIFIAAASPPTPPTPADSHLGTRPYPPGITAQMLEEAAEKLEELTSQPSEVDSPELPWNRRPSNYTLFKIDQHIRHNPSYRAVSEFGNKMFVKFPCLPGQEGMDMGGLCKAGIPEGVESTPLRHQTSIQKVSDTCGFGKIKSRTWSAPMYGITPEGHVIDGQTGFFAEWMDGVNPESMRIAEKANWVSKVPMEWIWWATLHDFIMCESDRHQGNLVVHEDATFRFIDNDHELNNRMVMGTSLIKNKDVSCMPNSIFLPHTLETWRVWKYRLPLSKLDMRCWTGPTMDIPIPSKIRACLEHFSSHSAEELQREFDMVRLEIAESLRQRSKDLLELGFWQALLQTVGPQEAGFWWHPQRLKWEEGMFPHWRGSLWRPLQEPNCTLGTTPA